MSHKKLQNEYIAITICKIYQTLYGKIIAYIILFLAYTSFMS